MRTPVSVSELPPFVIGPYLRNGEAKTPLLDPTSVRMAFEAYSAAEQALRNRAGSALRPSVRHTLANRVLSFAIFGERDPRMLKERVLAHFP